MSFPKGAALSGLVLAAAATMLLTDRPPPLTEAERPTRSVRQQAASPEPLPGPARQGDVVEALDRAFDGCVTPLEGAPPFVVADLNGDGSEDLAVEVHALGPRLRQVNDELANWTVQDLEPGRSSSKSGPGRVAADERLLAVIHGHGPAGWRSPDARQAHLLKNASGVELKRVTAPRAGRSTMWRARGDVLLARLDGTEGFLYWTGARYSLAR